MAGTVQLPGVQMVLWNPPPAAQSWKFPVGQPDLSCCLPPHPESSPNPGVGVKCKVSVPEAPSWAAQAIGVCLCMYLQMGVCGGGFTCLVFMNS